MYANIARSIQGHAGILERTHIELGVVEQCGDFIKKNGPFDLILLDHHKDYYLPDFKFLEKAGAIAKGTLVLGDNIIYPGSPEYLEHFKTEALKDYKSILLHSFVEYTPNIKDAILVSEKL